MLIDTYLARPWAGASIAAAVAIAAKLVSPALPLAAYILYGVAGLLAFGMARSKLAASRTPPPGNIHTIDGINLHILAEGEAKDSHPIIWVSGGHGEGLIMGHLHQAMKTETRSILFDRPGSGWSQIDALPLTFSSEIDKLKKLLEANGEQGPFVLVGHSFGGMFSANFAHHYPELVAGLVLLDPTPPWNVAFAGKLSFGTIIAKARLRALASHFGLSNLMEKEIDEVDSDYYRALADKADTINSHSVSPQSVIAEASIFHAAMDNPFDLVIGKGALGDIPLVLVGANESEEAHAETQNTIQETMGLSELQSLNLWQGLTDSMNQIPQMSSKGSLVKAPPGATHMHPYEHPEFVLEEVRKMIAKAPQTQVSTN